MKTPFGLLTVGTLVFPLFFDETLSSLWWQTIGTSFLAFIQVALHGLYGDRLNYLGLVDNTLLVSRPHLTFLVGRTCSGFEAFRIFALCFFLLLLLRKAAHTFFQWLGLFTVGTVWMMAINFFRITSLFEIGALLQFWLGNDHGFFVFNSFAHPYLGLIYYTAAITLFFGCAERATFLQPRATPCLQDSPGLAY